MQKRNLKYWFVFTVFFLLLGISHGQQGRPVKILYLHASEDAPKKAYVYASDKFQTETELPRNNFSEMFEIPKGDQKISFLAGKLEEGEKVSPNAPSVLIPESWSKVVLLVIEDKSNEIMPILVKKINASDHVFGPGNVLVVNMSSIGIIGKMGEKAVNVKANSTQVVKEPLNKSGFYPTKILMKRNDIESPQPFIHQTWGHNPKRRYVLFIIPRPVPQYATYYTAPLTDL